MRQVQQLLKALQEGDGEKVIDERYDDERKIAGQDEFIRQLTSQIHPIEQRYGQPDGSRIRRSERITPS